MDFKMNAINLAGSLIPLMFQNVMHFTEVFITAIFRILNVAGSLVDLYGMIQDFFLKF